MASIFQRLFGPGSSMPGYKEPEVSPDTANIIGVEQARAMESPEQILATKYSGAPKPTDIQAQVAGASQYNKALGMASPDQLNEVLTKRAQKSMEADLSKAKRLGLTEAWSTKARRQQIAGRHEIRKNQIDLEIEEGKRAADEEKKKARNSTLGSILGIAGSVAGTVGGGLVGGPMGAQVGSKVGGSVGGLAGGE